MMEGQKDGDVKTKSFCFSSKRQGTTKRKHHIQERQEVSHFPASEHKAARERQDSMTDKHETQIKKRILLKEALPCNGQQGNYWRA